MSTKLQLEAESCQKKLIARKMIGCIDSLTKIKAEKNGLAVSKAFSSWRQQT